MANKDDLDKQILEYYSKLTELYITNNDIKSKHKTSRSNTNSIVNLHNKVNCIIQKRNRLYLFEPNQLDEQIKIAKIQMLTAQLKWLRQSKSRVAKKHELISLLGRGFAVECISCV